MKVVKLTSSNLKEVSLLAAQAIKRGGLVVVPSDTAYGLAADAANPEAVRKIYDFKGRRFAKGITVFLPDIGDITKYAEISDSQKELVQTLLPGPFSVIFNSKHVLARELEAPDGTLGVRVIDHPFINHLTSNLKHPITATSANLAGRGPHYSIDAFLATLSAKKKALLDLVVEAGSLPIRKVSTLVRLAGDQIEVLREGDLNLHSLGSWTTTSEQATKKIAQGIFRRFLSRSPIRQSADQKPPNSLKSQNTNGVVLILKGNLGTGKTVFAKGIGELFGLELTSPTFALVDEYDLSHTGSVRSTLPVWRDQDDLKPLALRPNRLYHLDLYRLESEAEIADLHLEQFLRPGNLLLIEWGEKLSVFQELKARGAAFFLLHLTELNQSTRQLSLFQI